MSAIYASRPAATDLERETLTYPTDNGRVVNGGFFPAEKWRRELRDSDLDPKVKELLRVMADFHHPKTARTFPSIERLQLEIVNDAGRPVSKSSIIRRRKAAIKSGWLRPMVKGYRGRTSVYRLVFPEPLRGVSDLRVNRGKQAKERVSPIAGKSVSAVDTPSAVEVQTSSALEKECPPLNALDAQDDPGEAVVWEARFAAAGDWLEKQSLDREEQDGWPNAYEPSAAVPGRASDSASVKRQGLQSHSADAEPAFEDTNCRCGAKATCVVGSSRYGADCDPRPWLEEPHDVAVAKARARHAAKLGLDVPPSFPAATDDDIPF